MAFNVNVSIERDAHKDIPKTYNPTVLTPLVDPQIIEEGLTTRLDVVGIEDIDEDTMLGNLATAVQSYISATYMVALGLNPADTINANVNVYRFIRGRDIDNELLSGGSPRYIVFFNYESKK